MDYCKPYNNVLCCRRTKSYKTKFGLEVLTLLASILYNNAKGPICKIWVKIISDEWRNWINKSINKIDIVSIQFISGFGNMLGGWRGLIPVFFLVEN